MPTRRSLSPKLSMDLEREIFILCAVSEPHSIPTLMRLASRVKAWVEPLLWRTVTVDPRQKIDGYPVFTWEVLMLAIKTKPAVFFHRSVRNLALNVIEPANENIAAVLSVCTGVENLSIIIFDGKLPYIPPLPPLIAPLRLKHLYADPRSLFRSLTASHACFSDLTHLELRGQSGFPSPTKLGLWTQIPLLPHLTHLSFESAGFLPICSHLLKACPALTVLVSLVPPVENRQYAPHFKTLSRDVRFVAMRCLLNLKDWQMGAHGGADYWRHAEDFIAMRRAEEVDAFKYEISEDFSEKL
ncbi:hypothetical protein B0H11DRAFT_2193889 [Mycena galericulata]|nr:hypothetical protein B0H11DRAFT_2115972 [Mycena galericulata]KAJ7480377.1 hypothetical protein B0H11DRAFT_2193889 [Mycena galericulata]